MNSDSLFLTNLIRPEILNMKAYSSARSLVDSKAQNNCIFLDANENSFSSSKWAKYPDQQPTQLKNKLSDIFSIKNYNFIVTRGSDEAIDCLIRSCVRAHQDEVISCPPTYGMYKTSTETQGGFYIEAPLDKNFDLDLDAILKKISNKTKIIFLCSPNNPTGNLLSKEKIYQLLEITRNKCLIVIDEAYWEFSDEKSWATDLPRFNHLIILRTLSKFYGQAGLRVGVMLADPFILDVCKKVLAPYPIPSCIENEVLEFDFLKFKKEPILNERTRLINALENFSFIERVYPTQTNFILIKLNDKILKSTDLVNFLRSQSVVIRDRSSDLGLQNCVRITVGNIEQNSFLIERIKTFEA